MWTKVGCIASMLSMACCSGQQANLDSHDAEGARAADTSAGGCSFTASLGSGWQSGSTYFNTLTVVLKGDGTAVQAPYQVTEAGPQYSVVTQTWGWSVTNADSQGVRGNVTDSGENLPSDGSSTVTLTAIVGGASADLTPQTVSINGQNCSGGSGSTGSSGSSSPSTSSNSGSSPSSSGYSQDDLQNNINALAAGGGQSGFGNPSNAGLWNSSNIGELYNAIVATHDQLFSFMSLADFAHAGLAEAAAESTMDPSHYDGTSMGLLQCTAATNGSDFNQHATVITAADGSTVLDPSEQINNTTLQDPGTNWVVWAWTLFNEGATGETPHEVSLGEQHAPAGWQGTLHDAMRSWLSGAGWGYSASDYASRGPTYFNKVETYLNMIAPGDFDRLMAVQIPQGQVSHFKDPGAGY